jgi:hypothetical protein
LRGTLARLCRLLTNAAVPNEPSPALPEPASA